MPPPSFFKMPGMPNATKSTRIDSAENGFVIYLRTADNSEEIRIGPNMNVALHIITEYFKNPIENASSHE